MTDAPKKRFTPKTWHVGIFGVLCLCIFSYLATYFLKNTKAYELQVDPKGLSSVQVDRIQKTLAPLGKMQFLTADLKGVHEKVSQISWVKSAKVHRDWHRGIVVSVEPRIAVANYGSAQMLDADGIAFVPADSRLLMDTNLVYLYGGDKDAHKVMRQMHQINEWFAPVNLKAKDLILTPRHTWIIVFDNGLRVVVDREDTEQKLYNFAVQLKGNLAQELPSIQSVDLRYKNGFTIAYKKS